MAPIRRVSLLLLGLAFALLLGTCTVVSWFPEYKDVNLISDLTLAANWSADPTIAALGTTADLYFDFSLEEDTAPPATGAQVFRLEYKSLLLQGDFEQATAGPVGTIGVDDTEGWIMVSTDTVGRTHEIVDSGAWAITGNTLHITTAEGDDRLQLNLRDQTNGPVDGLLDEAAYFVRFDFRSDDQPVIFEYNDGATPESLATWTFYSDGTNLDNVTAFPTSALDDYASINGDSGAVNLYFAFGSLDPGAQSTQDVSIDNIRLVRSDLLPRARLELPRVLTINNDADEPFELLWGRYRFSIWVHDDDTVGTVTNRYDSRSIVLEMSGGGNTWLQSFTRTADGWADEADIEYLSGAGGWTELSIETPLGESMQLANPNDPTETVLTLRISPSDWRGEGGLAMDAGSILISAPSLIFATADE